MLNWLPLSRMSCRIAFSPQVSGSVPASAPVNGTSIRSWLNRSNTLSAIARANLQLTI